MYEWRVPYVGAAVRNIMQVIVVVIGYRLYRPPHFLGFSRLKKQPVLSETAKVD